MCVVPHPSQSLHGDVVRQQRIQVVAEIFRIGDRCFRVEMDDVERGVHSRVGAPGAYGFDRATEQCAEALLQGLLHGRGVGLDLPAVVCLAEVGEL